MPCAGAGVAGRCESAGLDARVHARARRRDPAPRCGSPDAALKQDGGSGSADVRRRARPARCGGGGSPMRARTPSAPPRSRARRADAPRSPTRSRRARSAMRGARCGASCRGRSRRARSRRARASSRAPFPARARPRQSLHAQDRVRTDRSSDRIRMAERRAAAGVGGSGSTDPFAAVESSRSSTRAAPLHTWRS
jgi:hypothetical protein